MAKIMNTTIEDNAEENEGAQQTDEDESDDTMSPVNPSTGNKAEMVWPVDGCFMQEKSHRFTLISMR